MPHTLLNPFFEMQVVPWFSRINVETCKYL
jgi:hypothetical protein